MTENKNYISEIETPEGEILVVRDADYENLMPINDIITVYNSEELRNAIGNAKPNTTIILDIKEGTENPYGKLLTLTSEKHHNQELNKNSLLATKFPNNLTIKGIDKNTIRMAGLSVTSGVLSSEQGNRKKIDIQEAILSSNLTISDITFTNHVLFRNSQMENLTIQNCNFTDNANLSVFPNSYTDVYGAEKEGHRAADTRHPYHSLLYKNVIVQNCIFEDFSSEDFPKKEQQYAIRMTIDAVDGATIYKNKFYKSWDAAFQVRGGAASYTNYNYNDLDSGVKGTGIGAHSLSTGKIRIGNNWIENTQQRAFKIYRIENASIEIAFNTFKNISLNKADYDVEKIKIEEIRGYNCSVFETNNYNIRTDENGEEILNDEGERIYDVITYGKVGSVTGEKQGIYLNPNKGGNNLKINGVDNTISTIEQTIENKYEDIYNYIVAKLPRYTGEEDM